VELEGTLTLGLVQLKGQYGYAQSRIQVLGPHYSGDLAAGDRPLAIPANTAGGSVSIAAWRNTTLTGGVAYVGSWRAYDLFALYSCFAGTQDCRPGPGYRNYTISIPGFVKMNATVSQQITRMLSGYVSVDNLGNSTANEFAEHSPAMGRVTMIGARVRY
jgi:hypothetical protein